MKIDGDATFSATAAGTGSFVYGTTSTATLSHSTPKSPQEKEYYLNDQMKALKREIGELESEILRQHKNIEDLLNRIKEHEVVNFTKEELMFILSRVHPDKNPDSKLAHQLTQKLIRKRNG